MALRVWVARLKQPLTGNGYAALMTCLPPARRERLAMQPREKHGEVLLAYGLLWAALAEVCGWPTLPEIAVDAGGKPYLPAYPNVHFSLSHSSGAAAVAISDAPVGVDIQQIRPVRGELLARSGNAQTPEAFFQSWVRWEARAKRTGGGLLTQIRQGPPLAAGEHYTAVETFPGYAAGVAASGPLAERDICCVSVDALIERCGGAGT